VNGQKVDANHDLSSLIRQYKVGDRITLKVLRGNDYLNIEVVLEERKLKQ
jgi:S1-C subfamily serine protease